MCHKTVQGSWKRPNTTLFSEISDVLFSVIANCSRGFIIIDALDERSATDRVLPRFMEELFTFQAKTDSIVFATSRPIRGIPEEFERRGSSILEIRVSDQDIRKYLDGHGQNDIAKTCVTYLSFKAFETGISYTVMRR